MMDQPDHLRIHLKPWRDRSDQVNEASVSARRDSNLCGQRPYQLLRELPKLYEGRIGVFRERIFSRSGNLKQKRINLGKEAEIWRFDCSFSRVQDSQSLMR
jgi:hypothetical protein